MGQLNLVSELYRYFKEERLKHAREPGVYWVTDLVACSLKAKFASEYPELDLADLFDPTLVQGSLLHKGLELLLSQLLGAKGVGVEAEPEASLELDLASLGLGAGRAVVKGRADIVASLPGGGRVGIEIKTMRSDAQLPLEHHVDQVRAYNTLFSLSVSLLLYATPGRIAQFEVSDRMSVGEIARRIAEPKAPRYAWECRYCRFSVVCPSRVAR